jgi:hypothetical protein
MSIRLNATFWLVTTTTVCLLLAAATHVWLTGSTLGLSAFAKLLAPSLAITAAMGAVSYRLVPIVDLSGIVVGICRLAFIVGIIGVNICLLGVAIFGIPFVLRMLPES